MMTYLATLFRPSKLWVVLTALMMLFSCPIYATNTPFNSIEALEGQYAYAISLSKNVHEPSLRPYSIKELRPTSQWVGENGAQSIAIHHSSMGLGDGNGKFLNAVEAYCNPKTTTERTLKRYRNILPEYFFSNGDAALLICCNASYRTQEYLAFNGLSGLDSSN